MSLEDKAGDDGGPVTDLCDGDGDRDCMNAPILANLGGGACPPNGPAFCVSTPIENCMMLWRAPDGAGSSAGKVMDTSWSRSNSSSDGAFGVSSGSLGVVGWDVLLEESTGVVIGGLCGTARAGVAFARLLESALGLS